MAIVAPIGCSVSVEMNSPIALRIEPSGLGEVLLTVADDGPGIAAADRYRVFDRFTRLADARDRDSGGSGLGLAIVTEMIAAQGGTVTIGDAELTPGASVEPGLLVEVRLPRSPELG